MPLAAPLLPCTARLDIYDALLDAEPDSPTYQDAHADAVRLCAACTRQCTERITPSSGPRTVPDFDATEWIPARTRLTLPPNSRPPQRRTKWAPVVAALASQGLAPAAIATALDMHESAVTRLLALATSDRVA